MLANVRIEYHPEGVADLLGSDPAIKKLLLDVAQEVAAEAEATASSAEEGSGGRIDGYASAGFSVEWDQRSKRSRALVRSHASMDTFMAAYFHTIKRDGVDHLRKALYKFTSRG